MRFMQFQSLMKQVTYRIHAITWQCSATEWLQGDFHIPFQSGVIFTPQLVALCIWLVRSSWPKFQSALFMTCNLVFFTSRSPLVLLPKLFSKPTFNNWIVMEMIYISVWKLQASKRTNHRGGVCWDFNDLCEFKWETAKEENKESEKSVQRSGRKRRNFIQWLSGFLQLPSQHQRCRYGPQFPYSCRTSYQCRWLLKQFWIRNRIVGLMSKRLLSSLLCSAEVKVGHVWSSSGWVTFEVLTNQLTLPFFGYCVPMISFFRSHCIIYRFAYSQR